MLRILILSAPQQTAEETAQQMHEGLFFELYQIFLRTLLTKACSLSD